MANTETYVEYLRRVGDDYREGAIDNDSPTGDDYHESADRLEKVERALALLTGNNDSLDKRKALKLLKAAVKR